MAQAERTKEEVRDNKRARTKAARGKRAAMTGDYQITFEGWLVINALNAALLTKAGALRIGLTRDGGALALGVYVGEDYATEYVRSSENLAEACGEIAEAWLDKDAEKYFDLIEALKAAGYAI